jgi:hypothetical protein
MIKAKEFRTSMSVELTATDDISGAGTWLEIIRVPDREVIVSCFVRPTASAAQDTELAEARASGNGAGTISLSLIRRTSSWA